MIIHFLIFVQVKQGGARAVGSRGALMINDICFRDEWLAGGAHGF